MLVEKGSSRREVDETGRGASDRLRHEAELLRRFAGILPVPTVYDLIEDGEDVFLAMEDVKGETLSDYVQRLAGDGRLLSTADVVACGMELTALLRAIHDQGVVHRDLKSDNVVVGIDRRLWLVDFELAHDLNWQVVPDGRGTEGYMSPQAAEGSVPTVLDDVYGLGAILYFLATAAEPSWAPADAELTRRPIPLLNPDISSPLVSVIDRCLAASAESRLPSMGAVAEALERSLVSVDFKAVHGQDQRDLESEAGARREPAPSPDVWAILCVHRLVVIRRESSGPADITRTAGWSGVTLAEAVRVLFWRSRNSSPSSTIRDTERR